MYSVARASGASRARCGVSRSRSPASTWAGPRSGSEIVVNWSVQGSPGTELLGTKLEIPGGATLTVVGFAATMSNSASAWVSPEQMAVLHPSSAQMLYGFTDSSTQAQLSAGLARATTGLPKESLTGAQTYLTLKQAFSALADSYLTFMALFGVLGLLVSTLVVGNVVSGAVVSGAGTPGYSRPWASPRTRSSPYLTMLSVPAVASSGRQRAPSSPPPAGGGHPDRLEHAQVPAPLTGVVPPAIQSLSLGDVDDGLPERPGRGLHPGLPGGPCQLLLRDLRGVESRHRVGAALFGVGLVEGARGGAQQRQGEQDGRGGAEHDESDDVGLEPTALHGRARGCPYGAHPVASSVLSRATRPSATSIGRADGTGRGLLGLRERVAVYGGDLDARRRLGGGYRVRARSPLGRP